MSLNDKVLLKGEVNLTHQSLSLRTLEKIFIIDETRIIADYSPLGTGQNTEKTLEKALLKLLLTGDDDSKVFDIKKNFEENSILEKKIVNLNHLIDKEYFFSAEKEKEIEKANLKLDRLNKVYIKSNEELNESILLNKSTLTARNNVFKHIDKLQNELNEKNVLLQRFELLEYKYASDKERLEGLNEATEYIDFYDKTVCPTCSQKYEKPISEEYIKNILKSVNAEISKINNNISGLSKTIENINLDIEEILQEIENLNFELSQYNDLLEIDIKEKLDETNKIKKSIDLLKDENIKDNYKINARKETEEELIILNEELNKKDITYRINEFDMHLKDFNSNIEKILERWSFEKHSPTTFNYTTRDIVIADKERGHFGKGFRAIGFSAFVIALMLELKKTNRHPGFVVLDSPLTAYKKADKNKNKETIEEELSENLIYCFYSDLADSYNDDQIIVFDNQEPDPSLHDKMNYIHFSKNKEIGRYGFFE